MSRQNESSDPMWHWDQGRTAYFQYDALRTAARFFVDHQWTRSNSELIRLKTGLDFAAPSTHSPWRNYIRVFKSCLLVSDRNNVAVPTAIAHTLAQPGAVTCDEYIHFLIEATTDPSPAFKGWNKLISHESIRYPLCFALKYLLVKAAFIPEPITSINEAIGAYIVSKFTGKEDDTAFISLLDRRDSYAGVAASNGPRQARESIKFISQISYLHSDGSNIITSLTPNDARNMFQTILPINGIRERDGDAEILRVADLFRNGSTHDFPGYESTVASNMQESGFQEGSKVKKTHIVIERNARLREMFFEKMPTTICDACDMDTQKRYPWVNRTLDLHHVLPLSSGTQVDAKRGTILDNLVPICPTCHRAVHRFYDVHLKKAGRADFDSEAEARSVYEHAIKLIVVENRHA